MTIFSAKQLRNLPAAVAGIRRATTAHIHLTGKQEIAALQHDHSVAATLEPQVVAADRARHVAREAIAKHEDEHQS